MTNQSSTFLAILSSLKYIDRWALMRNARPENLAEHSLEVALIAHALVTLGNVRHNRNLDANAAAVLGLFHDASETLTGDMPTPVKYATGQIRDAYKDVESSAAEQLLATLPEDLRSSYAPLLNPQHTEDNQYLLRLVKAADKLSALIKCLEEAQAGNAEFRTAEVSTRQAVEQMASELPEVADFLEDFLPAYGSTLDELLGR